MIHPTLHVTRDALLLLTFLKYLLKPKLKFSYELKKVYYYTEQTGIPG